MADEIKYESGAAFIYAECLPERVALPNDRHAFKKNQPATTEADRALIDEKLGRAKADEWLSFQISAAENGGVNPAINGDLFPERLDGPLDLDQVYRILANVIAWKNVAQRP